MMPEPMQLSADLGFYARDGRTGQSRAAQGSCAQALRAMVGRVHVQRPRPGAGLGSAAHRGHAARRRRHEIGRRPSAGTSLLYAGRLTDAQDCPQRVVDLYAAPSDGRNPLLFVYDQRVLTRARLARVLSLRGRIKVTLAVGACFAWPVIVHTQQVTSA